MSVDAYLRAGHSGSRREIARRFGTTPATVEKYAGSAMRREGDSWVTQAPGGLSKAMNVVVEGGDVVHARIDNPGDRALLAKYHHALRAIEERHDFREMRRLRRVTVRDETGARHRLETNERTLRQMARTGRLKGLAPY